MNHDNNLPRWFTNEEAEWLYDSICKIACFSKSQKFQFSCWKNAYFFNKKLKKQTTEYFFFSVSYLRDCINIFKKYHGLSQSCPIHTEFSILQALFIIYIPKPPKLLFTQFLVTDSNKNSASFWLWAWISISNSFFWASFLMLL